MVYRIYPAELKFNKANASDTESAFLVLNLSIHTVEVSTKLQKDIINGIILILII